MSDVQWKRWGKEDAYFGVYFEDRFRKENIGSHLNEFFRTGEENVGWILDRTERYFGRVRRGSALEFGCGVGRMTMPLALRFERVVGLDISQDMMDEAGRNAERAGVTNVDFVTSDDTLSRAAGTFDFVLSYIVLQHIEPTRGLAIVGHLLDRVGPDGVAVLQASVVRPDMTVARRVRDGIRHNAPWIAALYGLMRGRGWSTLNMRMSEYDPTAILAAFKARGMGDVLVTEHYQGDVLTYHFTGRRPA